MSIVTGGITQDINTTGSIDADSNLIVGGTATINNLTVTGIFKAPNTGAQAYVIFQPGGTPAGNIYTTESSLVAATQALGDTAYVLFFDLSNVGGSYTFTTVGLLNLKDGATWTDAGFGYTIKFSNGTTVPVPPDNIIKKLTIQVAQSVDVVTLTNSNLVDIYDYATIINTGGTGAFINSGIGGNFVFILHDFSTIAGHSNTQRALKISGSGVMNVYLFDSVNCNAYASATGVKLYSNSPANYIDGANDSVLYTNTVVYGLFIDEAGGAAAGIPAASSQAGYIFDTSGRTYFSDGTSWHQLQNHGTTTLSSGVSPAITANISSSSSIVATHKDFNSSTSTGVLIAKSSDRVNGAAGSFKITSVTAGTASTNTSDNSIIDWAVLDS
jgi:hypothetical protein